MHGVAGGLRARCLNSMCDCAEQKREEAEGTAASEEAAAVSEEAAAASDVPAAMDASEAESDGGMHRRGRSSSQGQSSRPMQKAEDELLAKQPKLRSKKARRPLLSPCSLLIARCMVMRGRCMHGVAVSAPGLGAWFV